MKKIILSSIFLCTINGALFAAPRTLKNHRSSCAGGRCCVVTKEATNQSFSEKDRDYLMFTNFVGIVVNFAKLFLDPHNVPEAKQNAVNILNGINNLAHVITRAPLDPKSQQMVVDEIIDLCQRALAERQ